MVMIVIRKFPVVFLVLLKDDTNTPIYREKYSSLKIAQEEYDRLAFEYPQAQVILQRKEGDAVQVLYTRNPMRV
jgi:hypothetical protein